MLHLGFLFDSILQSRINALYSLAAPTNNIIIQQITCSNMLHTQNTIPLIHLRPELWHKFNYGNHTRKRRRKKLVFLASAVNSLGIIKATMYAPPLSEPLHTFHSTGQNHPSVEKAFHSQNHPSFK
jgi:hypothetical protein